MTVRYNPFEIESKWQQHWAAADVFKATEDSQKPKYYVLEMFPYPSGNIHVGHARNYIIGDVIARYKRAQGYSVLHPLGWDAFGMPAENAAIKNKVHPAAWTRKNIEQMKGDLDQFGLSIDWSRELATCEPDYYRHQQDIFIDMLDKGLAYQRESQVNWDPIDQTVLANEQVIDGRGWRSGAVVERRTMKQWFFRITKYAEELLGDLKTLNEWPDQVRTMQENWIGRSEGLTFTFEVPGWSAGLTVYTTRPDTVMGVTFCTVAPEHPLAKKVAESDPQAAEFIKECLSMGTSEEIIEKAEKRGYKTPFEAIHPITGRKVPVFIGNFVLMTYGTGAVMAVPAHDERDHAFAKKYGLPIERVIDSATDIDAEAYTEAGKLVNSGDWTGLNNEDAKKAIIAHFEDKGLGTRTVNWRLRDWGVSRQRYWGCPIPVVNCPDCGVVTVPKDQLPVTLPEDVEITGSGGNPLAAHPTWKHVNCPKCGTKAERETDTMDTFVDSSWYFARYTSRHSDKPLDKAAVNHWLPVDQYIGGIEHAVLHLLYARFFTKVLNELGYVNVKEPFKALLTQGMVLSTCYKAKDGSYINPLDVIHEGSKARHAKTGEELTVLPMEKMSKSKNNGVPPRPLVERYGADTLRLFSMFTAPVERSLEWADSGVEGAWRFLGRVWGLVHDAGFDVAAQPNAVLPVSALTEKAHKDTKRAIHKAVRKMGEDIQRFQFNTSIAAAMELSNTLATLKGTADATQRQLYREGVEMLLQALNPIVPHITEELWHQLGHNDMLVNRSWPTVDEDAAKDDEVILVVQVNGKLRERLTVDANISNDDAERLALEAVAPHIAGMSVVKSIVVPRKLVNVVVR